MKQDITELASHCIRCGFCLESCPTFKITGSEAESPRGRIYLARSAEEGSIEWADAKEHIDRCLGCLACETACPSGVQYGTLLELAREELQKDFPNQKVSSFTNDLTNTRKTRLRMAASTLLPNRTLPAWAARHITGVDAPLKSPKPMTPIPWPDLDEKSFVHKGDVMILNGCVMDVLYEPVHEALGRLLKRIGFRAYPTAGCCGALHEHSGFAAEANSKAERIKSQVPDEMPLIVDSAGCGSFMKRGAVYAGTQSFDASEFLGREGLSEILNGLPELKIKVTYNDACHLAHGQGIRQQPRDLIKAIPGIELIELDEADTCCGSAGTYNVFQPGLARKIGKRKVDRILKTGAKIVLTGNPGCLAWIEQLCQERGTEVTVMHTIEFLERAVSGLIEL